MFGKIKYITEGEAHVESLIQPGQDVDLMNNNVVFEAENQRILGEVEEVNNDVIKIRFLGEFIGDKYVSGVIRKPVLSSNIRQINDEELKSLMGTYSDKTFILGQSAIYKGHTVYVDINDLLSNHMAIFGNSGSGKSCGVSRMVQNLFSNPDFIAYNANIFIFDAYGEYKTAFSKLNELNPNYSYKFITTNPTDATDQRLALPVHLLTLDDMTLLLQVSSHTQIPIIERALKLVKVFADVSDEAVMYKNHLIAKALLAILFSNETTKEKKNEAYNTLKDLNYKKGKTSQIENLIKEKFNLNSCVKIEGDKISVTVDDKDASVEKANNIIKEVQSLYDTQMYITVKFQNK